MFFFSPNAVMQNMFFPKLNDKKDNTYCSLDLSQSKDEKGSI